MRILAGIQGQWSQVNSVAVHFEKLHLCGEVQAKQRPPLAVWAVSPDPYILQLNAFPLASTYDFTEGEEKLKTDG